MSKFNRYFVCLLSAFVLLLSNFTHAQSRPAADLIITNAKIWTVDKSLPMAQAVAVLRRPHRRRWIQHKKSTSGAAPTPSDRRWWKATPAWL